MEAVEEEPRAGLGLLGGESRGGDDGVPVLADCRRPDESWDWEKRQYVLC